MRLGEIAEQMRGTRLLGQGDPDISGIVSDSREAVPGCLFAALPGSGGDGMDYMAAAVRAGAKALLASREPATDFGLPLLLAGDARQALGEAADAFWGHPSRRLSLIGVTGTNGKTTTAYLTRHILNRAGRRCGMLGTVEYDLGGRLEPAPLTTPDAVRFTRSLAEMLQAGCRAAAIEASSHALSQERVWPHRFAAAVFTNLTRDHLDYHGDMEKYLQAKRRLFSRLDSEAFAVFNLRDPASARLAEGCPARRLGYFLEDGEKRGLPAAAFADSIFTARIAESGLSGQAFELAGPGLAGMNFRTPLVGRHNAENCLGAVLAALALGVEAEAITEALAGFPGVPGRLERIQAVSGAVAFVDYAHTDDALRSVLSVLRPLAPGKLITVFGCGGDRDRGKRPLMARAAEELSDQVVVTSDNPRTENPEAIISDVMAGFSRPERVTLEADRRRAVVLAAGMAGRGDAILVAGKGHEDYQIVGTEKRHLDDRELVRSAFGA
ncbi:MAG: UDP-N-acetylmuramoyl-L-alanyl-D-glutamate--2,6-diaminopimelate ligase [Planctomycetota bacterium]|jgi:UDP-N-acetylmuramoyl-L-alanyl-D-glutamate--2,6-diaminopimelate ligase|nr:UDP-N-acetylmuramoyl-L-alanyl-D-glutamate--2,6-diaminopimelate ligase [Planctomycetota bacterium]